MNKKGPLVILSAALSLLASADLAMSRDRSGPSERESPPKRLCGDFARLDEGPYLYVNNMWGAYQQPKGSLWSQCLDRSGRDRSRRQFSFAWNWPRVDQKLDAPFGFPSVSFGKNPNFPVPSTTALLPARVGRLKALSVTAETTIAASGAYDEFYNIFFVSRVDPAVTPSAVTVELALVIRHKESGDSNGFPFQPHVKDVVIDGQSFGLYVNPTFTPPKASPRILAFLVPRKMPLRDVVDIKAVTDALVEEGYVHDTDYLSNVDLGVEMYNSPEGNRGQLAIKRFAVSVGLQ